MVTRLISATGDEIKEMSPMDLKESIFKSEGRVVMGQHLLFAGPGLVRGVTNSELMFAFGADMVMLNTFDLDDLDNNPGLCGLSFQELKEKCRRPIGIYLGCPKAGSGTSIRDVVETAKRIKQKYKDQIFVFAGKWEDGINEKVLGDPLANYDAKEIIKELIDAGVDCIDLPAPGSRHGISVDMIRELVEYIHSYKPGTLAMTFLNSSVECADPDTIRLIALKMKETGADIHAIGDGGFSGCTSPENIHQLSVSLKGRHYTYFRMASVNR